MFVVMRIHIYSVKDSKGYDLPSYAAGVTTLDNLYSGQLKVAKIADVRFYGAAVHVLVEEDEPEPKNQNCIDPGCDCQDPMS